MALTASADLKGRAKIVSMLGLRNVLMVATSLNRKNIRYEVRYPDAWPGLASIAQDDDLLALLREPDALGNPLRCGVIYCRKKVECDRVAALLCKAGFPAGAYHADIAGPRRAAVQADWIAGRIHFMVATVAFGMGAHQLRLAA